MQAGTVEHWKASFLSKPPVSLQFMWVFQCLRHPFTEKGCWGCGWAGKETDEEIYGFGGTGHQVSRCQRWACRRSSQTGAHDWLWPTVTQPSENSLKKIIGKAFMAFLMSLRRIRSQDSDISPSPEFALPSGGPMLTTLFARDIKI